MEVSPSRARLKSLVASARASGGREEAEGGGCEEVVVVEVEDWG